MACNLTIKLANACTSGIGKLTSRLQLLRVWAEILCDVAGVTPPAAPLMDLPAFTSAGNYTLNWTAPAGATSYLLDLAEDAAFTIQILSDEPIGTNSSPIADVTGAVRYSRVRAVNAGGISPYSNVILFDTDEFPMVVPDDFESYTTGDDLEALNGGTNWASGYVSHSVFFLVTDDFESYTASADLGGLNGGTNWNSGYVSRP